MHKLHLVCRLCRDAGIILLCRSPHFSSLVREKWRKGTSANEPPKNARGESEGTRGPPRSRLRRAGSWRQETASSIEERSGGATRGRRGVSGLLDTNRGIHFVAAKRPSIDCRSFVLIQTMRMSERDKQRIERSTGPNKEKNKQKSGAIARIA